MTEGWEHFTDNENGEPVFLTDEGQLLDAAGTEYELDNEEPEYGQPEYGHEPDYRHEPTEAEIVRSVQSQAADLERQLDRRLTPRELGDMAEEIGGQISRGDPLDVHSAHVEHGAHYDLDHAQDRRHYMAERLKPLPTNEPVSRPPADAPAAEHQAYMHARLAGAEVVNEPSGTEE